jgi:hypothetical protein
MRSLRPLLACLAISASIIAACGSPAASGAGSPTATTGQGEPTATTPGEPTQPVATTDGGGGGGGGGANGSVTYRISGDYAASGELPFVPLVSAFSTNGWQATFVNENTEQLIQINAVQGNVAVVYGDTKVAIVASPGTGCTINLTKSDSTGLEGDFDCSGAIAANSATGTPINVTFSGAFSAHP